MSEEEIEVQMSITMKKDGEVIIECRGNPQLCTMYKMGIEMFLKMQGTIGAMVDELKRRFGTEAPG